MNILHGVKNFSFSRVLFTNDDGTPIVFYSTVDCADLKGIVNRGGGRLSERITKNSLNLCDDSEKGLMRDEGFIPISFIRECVLKATYLDPEQHRRKVAGIVSPVQLPPANFEDDDFFDDASSVSSFRLSKGRTKYTDAEDLKMLHFIHQHRSYNRVKGKELWKEMERQQVTCHPSESMRSRFLKTITPRIHLYQIPVELEERLTGKYKHTREVNNNRDAGGWGSSPSSSRTSRPSRPVALDSTSVSESDDCEFNDDSTTISEASFISTPTYRTDKPKRQMKISTMLPGWSDQGSSSRVQTDSKTDRPSVSGINGPSVSGINGPSVSGINGSSVPGRNQPSVSDSISNRPSVPDSISNRPSVPEKKGAIIKFFHPNDSLIIKSCVDQPAPFFMFSSNNSETRNKVKLKGGKQCEDKAAVAVLDRVSTTPHKMTPAAKSCADSDTIPVFDSDDTTTEDESTRQKDNQNKRNKIPSKRKSRTPKSQTRVAQKTSGSTLSNACSSSSVRNKVKVKGVHEEEAMSPTFSSAMLGMNSPKVLDSPACTRSGASNQNTNTEEGVENLSGGKGDTRKESPSGSSYYSVQTSSPALKSVTNDSVRMSRPALKSATNDSIQTSPVLKSVTNDSIQTSPVLKSVTNDSIQTSPVLKSVTKETDVSNDNDSSSCSPTLFPGSRSEGSQSLENGNEEDKSVDRSDLINESLGFESGGGGDENENIEEVIVESNSGSDESPTVWGLGGYKGMASHHHRRRFQSIPERKQSPSSSPIIADQGHTEEETSTQQPSRLRGNRKSSPSTSSSLDRCKGNKDLEKLKTQISSTPPPLEMGTFQSLEVPSRLCRNRKSSPSTSSSLDCCKGNKDLEKTQILSTPPPLEMVTFQSLEEEEAASRSSKRRDEILNVFEFEGEGEVEASRSSKGRDEILDVFEFEGEEGEVEASRSSKRRDKIPNVFEIMSSSSSGVEDYSQRKKAKFDMPSTSKDAQDSSGEEDRKCVSKMVTMQRVQAIMDCYKVGVQEAIEFMLENQDRLWAVVE